MFREGVGIDEAPLLAMERAQEAAPETQTGLKARDHWRLIGVMVLLTVVDTVLCSLLLFYYSETYANYINSGTGLFYIIVSTMHRAYLHKNTIEERNVERDLEIQIEVEDENENEIKIEKEKERGEGEGAATNTIKIGEDGTIQTHTQTQRYSKLKPEMPWYLLATIGFLNGTGNFFNAVGMVHTSGSVQTLLMLVAIPLVLFLSWIFLGKTINFTALFAAVLITSSTVIAAWPALTHEKDEGGGEGVQTYWYSVLIMLLAQLFYASEKVLEESSFRKYAKIDVLKMFQWTMIVQFFLYFFYYPLQAVPAFGGIDFYDIPFVIRDGLLCTVGMPPISDNPNRPLCTWRNPFLFFAYSAVDYCQYGLMLYVIQKGGANLFVLATALALPLSNLAFSLPFKMNGFGEPFSAANVAALVCAMIGFYIYEKYGKTSFAYRDTRRDDRDNATNGENGAKNENPLRTKLLVKCA